MDIGRVPLFLLFPSPTHRVEHEVFAPPPFGGCCVFTTRADGENTPGRKPWTLDGCRRMGGYVIEYVGGFSFLTIRGAGHMVMHFSLGLTDYSQFAILGWARKD